ncbi:MAG TPA: orotidine-5'-phosphate decarboxylase [Solirubrobacteraceae bacterium]|nr:orotidine-5'-phosphate decarboxylase [Solirubrobacteraceae bacterium]
MAERESLTVLGSPFGDTLAARVAERESQIVLGLDPDLDSLWPQASEVPGASSGPAARAAAAVLGHCRALIDAVAPACVAVKLQLARFEVLGDGAAATVAAVAAHAREHGLLVIADGKRGDIDVSARAYAHALIDGLDTPFGRIEGLRADLATVNPFMGRDSLETFIAAARVVGSGVLVLVRTSNAGARDVQDLELAEGGPVWESVARLTADLGTPGVGASGLSDVGAVIGATEPRHLERARELMPSAPFLLPGVGAQGGRVEDLAPAFGAGRASGLITASRSIADAHLRSGGAPAEAARAEAESLRAAAWALSG